MSERKPKLDSQDPTTFSTDSVKTTVVRKIMLDGEPVEIGEHEDPDEVIQRILSERAPNLHSHDPSKVSTESVKTTVVRKIMLDGEPIEIGEDEDPDEVIQRIMSERKIKVVSGDPTQVSTQSGKTKVVRKIRLDGESIEIGEDEDPDEVIRRIMSERDPKLDSRDTRISTESVRTTVVRKIMLDGEPIEIGEGEDPDEVIQRIMSERKITRDSSDTAQVSTGSLKTTVLRKIILDGEPIVIGEGEDSDEVIKRIMSDRKSELQRITQEPIVSGTTSDEHDSSGIIRTTVITKTLIVDGVPIEIREGDDPDEVVQRFMADRSQFRSENILDESHTSKSTPRAPTFEKQEKDSINIAHQSSVVETMRQETVSQFRPAAEQVLTRPSTLLPSKPVADREEQFEKGDKPKEKRTISLTESDEGKADEGTLNIIELEADEAAKQLIFDDEIPSGSQTSEESYRMKSDDEHAEGENVRVQISPVLEVTMSKLGSPQAAHDNVNLKQKAVLEGEVVFQFSKGEPKELKEKVNLVASSLKGPKGSKEEDDVWGGPRRYQHDDEEEFYEAREVTIDDIESGILENLEAIGVDPISTFPKVEEVQERKRAHHVERFVEELARSELAVKHADVQLDGQSPTSTKTSLSPDIEGEIIRENIGIAGTLSPMYGEPLPGFSSIPTTQPILSESPEGDSRVRMIVEVEKQLLELREKATNPESQEVDEQISKLVETEMTKVVETMEEAVAELEKLTVGYEEPPEGVNEEVTKSIIKDTASAQMGSVIDSMKDQFVQDDSVVKVESPKDSVEQVSESKLGLGIREVEQDDKSPLREPDVIQFEDEAADANVKLFSGVTREKHESRLGSLDTVITEEATIIRSEVPSRDIQFGEDIFKEPSSGQRTVQIERWVTESLGGLDEGVQERPFIEEVVPFEETVTIESDELEEHIAAQSQTIRTYGSSIPTRTFQMKHSTPPARRQGYHYTVGTIPEKTITVTHSDTGTTTTTTTKSTKRTVSFGGSETKMRSPEDDSSLTQSSVSLGHAKQPELDTSETKSEDDGMVCVPSDHLSSYSDSRFEHRVSHPVADIHSSVRTLESSLTSTVRPLKTGIPKSNIPHLTQASDKGSVDILNSGAALGLPITSGSVKSDNGSVTSTETWDRVITGEPNIVYMRELSEEMATSADSFISQTGESRVRASSTNDSLDDRAEFERYNLTSLMDATQSEIDLLEVRTEDEAPDIDEFLASPMGSDEKDNNGKTDPKVKSSTMMMSRDFSAFTILQDELSLKSSVHSDSETVKEVSHLSDGALQSEICEGTRNTLADVPSVTRDSAFQSKIPISKAFIKDVYIKQTLADMKVTLPAPKEGIAASFSKAQSIPQELTTSDYESQEQWRIGDREDQSAPLRDYPIPIKTVGPEEVDSPIPRPSPPEPSYEMDQELSPVTDFREGLTADNRVFVGVSPTEIFPGQDQNGPREKQEFSSRASIPSDDSDSQKDDFDENAERIVDIVPEPEPLIKKTSVSRTLTDSSVPSETSIESEVDSSYGERVDAMAFENTAFVGVDAIDENEQEAEEIPPVGSRSPYEVVRKTILMSEEKTSTSSIDESSINELLTEVGPDRAEQEFEAYDAHPPANIEQHIKTQILSDELDQSLEENIPELKPLSRETSDDLLSSLDREQHVVQQIRSEMFSHELEEDLERISPERKELVSDMKEKQESSDSDASMVVHPDPNQHSELTQQSPDGLSLTSESFDEGHGKMRHESSDILTAIEQEPDFEEPFDEVVQRDDAFLSEATQVAEHVTWEASLQNISDDADEGICEEVTAMPASSQLLIEHDEQDEVEYTLTQGQKLGVQYISDEELESKSVGDEIHHTIEGDFSFKKPGELLDAAQDSLSDENEDKSRAEDLVVQSGSRKYGDDDDSAVEDLQQEAEAQNFETDVQSDLESLDDGESIKDESFIEKNVEEYELEISRAHVDSVIESSDSDVLQLGESTSVIPDEFDDSEKPDKEEAREVAQKIIEDIKTAVARRPPLTHIPSEISDEDLVERECHSPPEHGHWDSQSYSAFSTEVTTRMEHKIPPTVVHDDIPKITLRDTIRFEGRSDSDASEKHTPESSVVLRRKAKDRHTEKRVSRDIESYSSSGETESHYQSFETSEKTPAGSRPCSSEFEILTSGQASDYETCATSQEGSGDVSGSYITAASSQEMSYATAHSSGTQSSRESAYSIDSESSGHLASLEISSEASETLVQNVQDLEYDIPRDVETPTPEVEDRTSEIMSREPYDLDIPIDVIRSGVEVPFMQGWEEHQASQMEEQKNDDVPPWFVGFGDTSMKEEDARLSKFKRRSDSSESSTSTAGSASPTEKGLSIKTAADYKSSLELSEKEDYRGDDASESSFTQSEQTCRTSSTGTVIYTTQTSTAVTTSAPSQATFATTEVSSKSTTWYSHANGPVEVDYIPEYDVTDDFARTEVQDESRSRRAVTEIVEAEGDLAPPPVPERPDDLSARRHLDSTAADDFTESISSDQDVQDVREIQEIQEDLEFPDVMRKQYESEDQRYSHGSLKASQHPSLPESDLQEDFDNPEEALGEYNISQPIDYPLPSDDRSCLPESEQDDVAMGEAGNVEAPIDDWVEQARIPDTSPEEDRYDESIHHDVYNRNEVNENIMFSHNMHVERKHYETEEAMEVGSDKFPEEEEDIDVPETPYTYGMQFERDFEDVPGYNDLYTHEEEDEETIEIDRTKRPPASEAIPVFDTLAGKKFFSRVGELDEASNSSLQEFEKLEAEIAMTRKSSVGSADSLEKPSLHSRSGEHDDVSVNSLTEFEKFEQELIDSDKTAEPESEPITVVRLSEIEEGHESQASETSQETLSEHGERSSNDSDDYEKRMSEIDEIIRQVQTKVEEFDIEEIDTKSPRSAAKQHRSLSSNASTESSLVDRSPSPKKEQDSLECDARQTRVSAHGSTDQVHVSSVPRHVLAERTTSGHSLESWESLPKSSTSTATQYDTESLRDVDVEDGDYCPDRIDEGDFEHDSLRDDEVVERDSDLVEKDSLRERSNEIDSLDELKGSMQDSLYHVHEIDNDEEFYAEQSSQISSSGGYRQDDLRSQLVEILDDKNGRMEVVLDSALKGDCMVSSTDSLEPSSSTATHATYQFETDSMMSSSVNSAHTSGEESNTMVSGTDVIEPENKISYSFSEGDSQVTVTELAPQQKFSGAETQGRVEGDDSDATSASEHAGRSFDKMEEVRTVDEKGNVVITRKVKRTVILDPQQTGTFDSEEKMKEFLKQSTFGKSMGEEEVEEKRSVDETGNVLITRTVKRHVLSEPQVHTQTFSGPDADSQSEQFLKSLETMPPTEEDLNEFEDTDEHGNLVRVTQQVIIRPEVRTMTFTGPNSQKDIEDFMRSCAVESQQQGRAYFEDSSASFASTMREASSMQEGHTFPDTHLSSSCPFPDASTASSESTPSHPGSQRVTGESFSSSQVTVEEMGAHRQQTREEGDNVQVRNDFWVESGDPSDGSTRVVTSRTTTRVFPDGQTVTETTEGGEDPLRQSMQDILEQFMTEEEMSQKPQ